MDSKIRTETMQAYAPRDYNKMSDREKQIAQNYFNAGRGDQSKVMDARPANIHEEAIAARAYEAGVKYEVGLKDGD